MPTPSQNARLLAVTLLLWVVATAYLHFLPSWIVNPLSGALAYVTTIPVAWLSIVIIRMAAQLTPAQLLPGVCLVGTAAMMLDGAVLRWMPHLYATDERVLHLGAAWLLWGYGLSLGIALLMSRRAPHPAQA
ncbi:DUF5367 family protein [Acidomonas methanolica]|uniref:DUF5367 family protein n=1 Tax=Acidomonas methanolica TaxID=437 RepID=UPI00211AA1CD|nr:DUF5367 family protein [Acidomonas methanolica]MCQ9154056.1 DUF5367 family protein [Acidomonas methanolica]